MTTHILHTICSDLKVGELLVPYGLGTLTPDDATRFEDHLIECHFCRTELEASFSALDILNRARPDLVEELKNSGEDFESQLARLHEKAQPARESESIGGKWRRFRDALLNPWVYGPAAATVAAIILLIQMDVQPPTQKLSVPQATQQMSRIMPQAIEGTVQENPAAALPTDEADKMAVAPAPHDELAARIPEPKRQAQADQQMVLKEEASEPKGTPELIIRSLRAGRALSAEKRSEQHSPSSAQAPVTASEPVVTMKEESMTEQESVAHYAPQSNLQERTSEFLKQPPAYQDLSLGSLLKKTPGFKVDPEMSKRAASKRAVTNPSMMDQSSSVEDLNTAAAYRTGIEAYQRQDYPAAVAALSDAVRGNHRNGQAWYYLGISQLQLQQWVPAMRALTEADSLAGGYDPAARYFLSLAIIKSGNLEKAKVFISRLAERQDSIGIRAAELNRLLEQSAKPK